MKRFLSLILSGLLIITLSGCGTDPKPKRQDFGLTSSGLEVKYYDGDSYNYTDIRNSILEATNIEREKEGLTPLTGNDNVATMIAFQRVYESCEIFEHQRPDGRKWDTIINEYGLSDWINIGENLGKGYPTVEKMMTAWMESPGHKKNILGDFTHMGVGVCKSDGLYYYTQFFVKYMKKDAEGNNLQDVFGNDITTQ